MFRQKVWTFVWFQVVCHLAKCDQDSTSMTFKNCLSIGYLHVLFPFAGIESSPPRNWRKRERLWRAACAMQRSMLASKSMSHTPLWEVCWELYSMEPESTWLTTFRGQPPRMYPASYLIWRTKELWFFFLIKRRRSFLTVLNCGCSSIGFCLPASGESMSHVLAQKLNGNRARGFYALKPAVS